MSTNQTASKSGLNLNGRPFFKISGALRSGTGAPAAASKSDYSGLPHGDGVIVVILDAGLGSGSMEVMVLSVRFDEAPSAFLFRWSWS